MEKIGLLALFKKNKHNKYKNFMPFIVAGDPDISQFKKVTLAIEPYIDILRIDIPFSDPIADGLNIQEVNVRAFND
ncbi:MAG: tryptophan synthase subunit alpha [Promethearchaeota archaeon]